MGGGGSKFIVTDHIATVVPDKSAKKYTDKICLVGIITSTTHPYACFLTF